jgi:hypothetical protein
MVETNIRDPARWRRSIEQIYVEIENGLPPDVGVYGFEVLSLTKRFANHNIRVNRRKRA